MESALNAYEGAFVVISHDERFLAEIKVNRWLRLSEAGSWRPGRPLGRSDVGHGRTPVGPASWLPEAVQVVTVAVPDGGKRTARHSTLHFANSIGYPTSFAVDDVNEYVSQVVAIDGQLAHVRDQSQRGGRADGGKLALPELSVGARARIQLIEQDHTNHRREWVRMGSPEYRDRRQLRALQDASELDDHPLQLKTDRTAGTANFSLTLPAEGVAAIHIS